MDDDFTRCNQQATISFNLEDHDAKRNLGKMLNVDDYIGALYHFKEDVLRRYFKYDDGDKVRFQPRGEEEYKEIVLDQNTMEYIEDAFYSLLEEYQINFDKLIF